jgi:hypothetical protein
MLIPRAWLGGCSRSLGAARSWASSRFFHRSGLGRLFELTATEDGKWLYFISLEVLNANQRRY